MTIMLYMKNLVHVLAGLVLVLSFRVAVLAQDSSPPNSDWPFSRGDLLGTAVSTSQVPDRPELIWEFKTNSTEEGFEGTPIIAEGRVFVGDFKGNFYAIRLSDGQVDWKVQLKQGVIVPAAYGGGRILLGDLDSNLYCLSSAGEQLWSHETDQPMVNGAIIRGDDAIYASDYGSLVCIDIKTGERKWAYETGDQIKSSPCLWNDLSFLGGCDAHLHKVNIKDGSSSGASIPLKSPTLSTPNVIGNVAIIPTQPGVIYAIQMETNESVWMYEPDSQSRMDIRSSTATLARLDGGKLVGTVVGACRQSRKVFALDASDGKPLWQTVLRKRSDSSPVICGNRVWIGASDGKLYAIDLKSGKDEWSFQLNGAIIGAPAIASNRLVVCTEKGTVACFGAK
jgi:outer membrane protein assembly factor BamB